jgi:hypothetical protein
MWKMRWRTTGATTAVDLDVTTVRKLDWVGIHRIPAFRIGLAEVGRPSLKALLTCGP